MSQVVVPRLLWLVDAGQWVAAAASPHWITLTSNILAPQFSLAGPTGVSRLGSVINGGRAGSNMKRQNGGAIAIT